MTRIFLTLAAIALGAAAQAQSASFPYMPTHWPADGAFSGDQSVTRSTVALPVTKNTGTGQ